ncbi:MAG: PIN domain-containing protein [Bryobacteraceae bacterium]
MRADRVLVDTGPLVAILSSRDSNHRRCVAELQRVRAPLLTCWPVLTEAAWLLRGRPELVLKLLGLPGTDLLRLLPLHESDAPAIGALLKKYRGLRLQLADAALLHLAHREGIESVFTLDVRDFSVMRTQSKRRLRLLPAD